jgi:hypothetical protein
MKSTLQKTGPRGRMLSVRAEAVNFVSDSIRVLLFISYLMGMRRRNHPPIPARFGGAMKLRVSATFIFSTLLLALLPAPAQPSQPANAIIRDNAGNLIQLIEG